MSLSNVRVKIVVDRTEWRDSFLYRPGLQDEIWVCDGEGGPVTPALFVGPEAGCFHGLYGPVSGLRDDHYYWMYRPLGTPPATRAKPLPQVTFDQSTQDRWTHSSTGLPSIGETVWIDDIVCGPQVARLDLISGMKPVFISVDGGHKYIGHRHWAMLMPPKRPI